MSVTPPPVHVPSPYDKPRSNLTARVDVPTEDGASIASFVYAPHGARDVPGTPFGIDPAIPPVLMLHGNGEEHGIFGPVIDAVVATGRPVVAVDSRSQGESTRGTASLSYELMAADAREVMARLGVWECHVLGFSDGGILGLLLARDWGAHVLTLTALGANLSPAGLPAEDTRWMAEAAAANAAWAEEGWEGEHDHEGNAVPSPAEAARIAELLALMVDQPQIDPASLAAITCPVTVMAGEIDVVLYEETHRIVEAIPGAEEYIVPGAEHTLPKICPDVVSDVLLQTIARNDVRRPVRGPLPADGVIVVPVDDSWEDELEELYRRVDAEPGTSGWVEGIWPTEGLARELVRAGKTLAALDCATSEILGAVSVDYDADMGDGWEPGHGRGTGGPDWEPLPEQAVACYHLFAVDPAARGRHVASTLLQAAQERARDLGAEVVRINTNVANVEANNLYAREGFTRHKPIWLPYPGLPLPGYTNLWEKRI